MHAPPTLLAATVTVTLTLTGCSGVERTASAPTIDAVPATTSEATTAPDVVAVPDVVAATDVSAPPVANRPAPPQPAPRPFSADTRPDIGQSAGPGPMSVANVDIASHEEGFDRIVFHIAGNGLAGWNVRYVKSAHSQGSGDPVDVAGAAVLEVTLTNMGYPADVAGPSYNGPRRIRPSGTKAVREAVNDDVYEGQHVFFVGTARELPFRVFRLDGPQRVVLDIQHPR